MLTNLWLIAGKGSDTASAYRKDRHHSARLLYNEGFGEVRPELQMSSFCKGHTYVLPL